MKSIQPPRNLIRLLRRISVLICACTQLVTINTADGGALKDVRTVALTDELVIPDSAISIQQFLSYALNNNGDAAFLSFTQGQPFVWAERDGQREFRAAPEAEVYNIFFNDKEEVLLSGFDGAPISQRRERIWNWSASGLTQLAGQNLPVVDKNGNPVGGYVQYHSYLSAVHPSGPLLFGGLAKSTQPTLPDNEGIWSGDGKPDGNRLLLSFGEQVPGEPAGTAFTKSTAHSPPKVNGHGRFIMGIELDRTGGSTLKAIVSNRDGVLRVLYKEGDQVPGGEPGAAFSSFPTSVFGEPVINNNGDIAFLAGVAPGLSGLFRDKNGTLELIAAYGQPVFGSTANSNIRSIGDLGINAHGRVVFSGSVNQPAFPFVQDGVFTVEENGEVRSIVVTGDAVPGIDGNAQFLVRTNSGFQLNRLGQIAISGQFTEVENGTLKLGVFVDDPALGLTPIALPGDLIAVSPNDIREIASAGIRAAPTGNQDGVQMALNERGQILFSAHFTDGTSGLFVSSAVAVPEPASGLFLFLAILLAGAFVPTRRILDSHDRH